MASNAQHHTTAQNDRFMRWPEVKERVGFSRSQIHNLIKQGRFPPQIKLGDRASAWLQSSVDAWMRERLAASCKDGEL